MIKNIILGIKAYFDAFYFISKLKLWRYFVVPMLISLLTAIGVGAVVYFFSKPIGEFISNVWVWDWGKDVFSLISNLFGGLLIVVLALIVYKHVIMILSAPFMGPVSEKIEAHLVGPSTRSKERSTFVKIIWRATRINCRNLLMELGLSLLILLISLTPVVGWFSSLLLFVVQAYYAGFGNMDYTLERHLKYHDSLLFVRQRRGIAIGNGIVFMLFLLIPIVGVIFVLPLSVTAATVRTVEALNLKKTAA